MGPQSLLVEVINNKWLSQNFTKDSAIFFSQIPTLSVYFFDQLSSKLQATCKQGNIHNSIPTHSVYLLIQNLINLVENLNLRLCALRFAFFESAKRKT